MNGEQIFIPRPDESDRVDSLVQRCSDGQVQLLWFFGETGQGKTFFLRNYLDSIREHAFVSYASCGSPLGNQSTTILKPHQPLKDVFEDLLANQASARRRLNLVKNISLTVLAMIPIVGEFAYGVKEIRRDLKEFRNGTREVDFSDFVQEYFNDLKHFSGELPVVLVIDDAQWVDVPTIEALRFFYFSDEFRDARITLVLSGRRDEMEAMPDLLSLYTQTHDEIFCSELTLPPFSTAQIREYFTARFPMAEHHPDLLLWLEQKSGGNPFFLTTYIQHLLMKDLLDANGTLRGDLESYRGLPAEIRLVTSWLMKSLDDNDLHLLLTASVLGFEFSLHELIHLTQRSALELIRSLRRAKTQHGIIEPVGYRLVNGKESTVYRFSQHAIHTALYNELTAEEKETLHRMTAHYLNELRLSRGDDADTQNSIASALMLHSRLGKEPELEYQSILMKAQHTSDPLDEEEILQHLTSLSLLMDIPYEQLRETFQHAMQLAPLHTRHVNREQMAISQYREEYEFDALSALLGRVLSLLRRNSTAEANVILEMHLMRIERRKQSAHPLVHVLYALSCEMLGRESDIAIRSLKTASQSTQHLAMAAFAKLGLALFENEDDTEVLGRLKEASAYSGRHMGVVQAIIGYIISTRFAGRENFATILTPDRFTPRMSENVREHYPRTARILGKR